MLRRSGDDDVGETRRLALAPRFICHRASDPGYGHVEGKNAVVVEVQDGRQPRRQTSALAGRPLAPQFADAVLDFRHRYRR